MANSIINPSVEPLTHRERFRHLMHFEPVDRGIHWEFGYLAATMKRWHEEGLPQHLEDMGSVEAHFGVDPKVGIPINGGFIPPFEGEDEVIEVRENSRVVKSPDGMIKEIQKEGETTTIPHYIKMPIANRDDWLRFKERLDPTHPDRWKTDWKKIGEELNKSDKPVGINLGSYFGTVRDWIGFENIALMCYDDRPLLEEIIATRTELQYTQIEAALEHCRPDYAGGWEDMCFRNGPIISPTMFRDLVLPHLRRVCNLLKGHGCDIIWTDCDGNINDLVPIWLEAGVNCMFPIEVQGGSDPVELREKYGKKILLVGGLAKYEFSKGKREIIAEFKRVEKVVAEGGYIPHGDHRIPEDVPYENYKYYVREKLVMLGWPKNEIEAISGLEAGGA